MKRLTLLAVTLVTLATSAASFAGFHFGFNFGRRPACRPVYIAPQPCCVVRHRPVYACPSEPWRSRVVPAVRCYPRKVHRVCYAPRARFGFNFGVNL